MTESTQPAPTAEKSRVQLSWCKTRDVIAILSTLLSTAAYALPSLAPIAHGAEQNVCKC